MHGMESDESGCGGKEGCCGDGEDAGCCGFGAEDEGARGGCGEGGICGSHGLSGACGDGQYGGFCGGSKGNGYGIRVGGGTILVRMQGMGVDYRQLLLNWAKTELLKEKVKAKLDKKYGKELEGLADALIEVMGEEAGQKKEMAKKKEDTRKKMKNFFEGAEVI